ncbi:hypothetical protein IKS38_02790 [bacterium]|nr:hypothetical protein [bacterium]
MHLLTFLLLLGAAVSASAAPETVWSDTFGIDTALAQTVDLKSSDPMFLSTVWYGGIADEADITAVGLTSGAAYDIAVLKGANGTSSNTWDYFVDNADLRENFLLTFTTKSGNETVSTETATVRVASTLQDEGTWSGNFTLDTVGTAPGYRLTLLTTDDIVYDSHWAEGNDRVIKVRAISHEAFPSSYDLYESSVDGHGTFNWDYLSDEVPADVTYTLAYEIQNEAGTQTYAAICAQPVIKILPEPLTSCAFLVLAAFFAMRRKGGRG